MLKMELYLNKKGNIEKLLYFNDCNSDNALNLILKKNLMKYKLMTGEENDCSTENKINRIQIFEEEDNNVENKNNLVQGKIKLSNKNEKSQIFHLLDSSSRSEESFENIRISSGKSDIGLNDVDFFVGIAYIYLKKHPNNIILKIMPFLLNNFENDFFEEKKPSYEDFINQLEISESNNNTLFIFPLTSLDHLSLMIVCNYKLYLLDSGLYHSSDDSYSFISKKIDKLYHELSPPKIPTI